MSPVSRVQDGRALVSGTIKAEDQQAEIAGERPLSGKVPLTPAQQRAIAEDRWPDDAEPPPGYEAGIVVVSDDPRRAAGPTHTPPPPDPTQPHSIWDRIDGDGGEAGNSKEADVIRKANEQAEKIREYARADVKRAKARVAAAIQNGSPEEREKAADDARATVAFAQRVKDKIGL